MEKNGRPKKKKFSLSVLGASHRIKGQVCQDASGIRRLDGDIHIAIVADGHGDPTCFRSDRGSAMAVSAAMEILGEFAGRYKNRRSLEKAAGSEAGQRQLLTSLTDSIVAVWRESVKSDLAANELTEDDLAQAGKYREHYFGGRHLERIYGSTLVAALEGEDYLLLIQQGDGRCDLLKDDGTMVQPVPEDERCRGNITTSLSDEIADREIRSILLPLDDRTIGCYLSTDGVENGFYDDESLQEFLIKTGLALAGSADDQEGEILRPLLQEVTDKGNGDDVSMAGWIYTDRLTGSADRIIEGLLAHRRREEIDRIMRKLESMEGRDQILRERVRKASAQERGEFMKEYMEYHNKYNKLKARAEKLALE